MAVESGAGLNPFKRVELPGGPVSLVPMEQLQTRITELGASAAQAQSESFAAQAQTKMAAAGAVMAERWQEWPAQELFEPIRQAIALQQQRGGLDAALSALAQHPHQGLWGFREVEGRTQGVRNRARARRAGSAAA